MTHKNGKDFNTNYSQSQLKRAFYSNQSEIAVGRSVGSIQSVLP